MGCGECREQREGHLSRTDQDACDQSCDDNQWLVVFAVAEIAGKIGPEGEVGDSGAVHPSQIAGQGRHRRMAVRLAPSWLTRLRKVLKTLNALAKQPEQINAIRALQRIGPDAKAGAWLSSRL